MRSTRKKGVSSDMEVFSPSYKVKVRQQETQSNDGSEKYNDVVKVFLAENNVFADRNKKQYKIIYNVLNDLELPSRGEVFGIRTQQQINLFSIVSKILMEHSKISDLVIATYTLNMDIFDILIGMVKSGKIGSLKLLIASSYSFRSPKNYELFKKVCLGCENVSLVFAWSHFKITLARCGSDDFYQFEGSMNYSINNMAENIILCNSKEIYEEDYNFITNIMIDSNNAALDIIC